MNLKLLEVRLDRITGDDACAQAGETLFDVLREEGLYEPLFVRDVGDGWYRLLAGPRCLKAVRTLGWEKSYAIVVPATAGDLTDAEVSLLIYQQRETLGPLHKARLVQQVIDSGRATPAEMARRLGTHRGNISHMLKVLRFRDLVAAIEREGLQFGAAKAIAALSEAQQAAFLEELRALKGDGRRFPPVRFVEERVQELRGTRKPVLRLALPPELPPELLPLLVSEALAQGGGIDLEDAPDRQTRWTLQVPRAQRERVAEMLRQHQAETAADAQAA